MSLLGRQKKNQKRNTHTKKNLREKKISFQLFSPLTPSVSSHGSLVCSQLRYSPPSTRSLVERLKEQEDISLKRQTSSNIFIFGSTQVLWQSQISGPGINVKTMNKRKVSYSGNPNLFVPPYCSVCEGSSVYEALCSSARAHPAGLCQCCPLGLALPACPWPGLGSAPGPSANSLTGWTDWVWQPFQQISIPHYRDPWGMTTSI